MTDMRTHRIENLEAPPQGLTPAQAEEAQGGAIWENADGSIEILVRQYEVTTPRDLLSGIGRG